MLVLHHNGQPKVAKHGSFLASDKYVELGRASETGIERTLDIGLAYGFQISMTDVDGVQILEPVHGVLNLKSGG